MLQSSSIEAESGGKNMKINSPVLLSIMRMLLLFLLSIESSLASSNLLNSRMVSISSENFQKTTEVYGESNEENNGNIGTRACRSMDDLSYTPSFVNILHRCRRLKETIDYAEIIETDAILLQYKRKLGKMLIATGTPEQKRLYITLKNININQQVSLKPRLESFRVGFDIIEILLSTNASQGNVGELTDLLNSMKVDATRIYEELQDKQKNLEDTAKQRVQTLIESKKASKRKSWIARALDNSLEKANSQFVGLMQASEEMGDLVTLPEGAFQNLDEITSFQAKIKGMSDDFMLLVAKINAAKSWLLENINSILTDDDE